jgi:hypothetical protein
MKITSAAAAVAAALALAGCAASAGHGTAGPGASAAVSQPASPSHASVRLVWSHTGKFFGDTRVWYVARVTNPGGFPASVALDARALDAAGTIVGSSQETLPNIPAHTHFDFLGELGGGMSTVLTGAPARIEVVQASSPFGRAGAVELPMLGTSEVMLTAGSAGVTDTDAPYASNLTVKVTNTTGQMLNGGVTQQVVLYDAAGRVVGGDTGSSDNMPNSLPAGMSYRESWTGIPAVGQATRAAYTVWPAT